MMEEHQESVDVSSKSCLCSRYPQENHHIPQEHQGRNMTTIKAESVDEDDVVLWKYVANKKCLVSDNPQDNHQIAQKHQGRKMTNIKVECLDKDEISFRMYKEELTPVEITTHVSRAMITPERPPCPRKAQRMRKPIKSEILRFGKLETRLEIEEEFHCPGDALRCKQEKLLLHISKDGYSKHNTSERWLQHSTEDNHNVLQDDEALNLTSNEKNFLQSKVKENTFRPDGSNSRSRPDSDCSEDYGTIQDYETDCLGVGTDEAASQSDSEEEMYLTDERRIREEDANGGYEVSYCCSENMYRSATTSTAADLESNCYTISGAYEQNAMEEKQFICTECGKSFSLYSYLTKHQRSHSGEKPFSCNECGKCFTYKPSLISHQRVHTGEKPFSCSECGKLFSSKFNLKMHEKIHSGDKPVVCPACGKCFSNNPALVKHLRIHTGEKPFSCPECGKFFSSKSGLNAHLIIHTGEKPYMCSECGKSFANHSNLISHRIIHTGEKPYVCPECGKGFANQSNLAKHKVIHTEEKPFLCMECGKFFTRKGSLDKHRMRIHEKMKLV